MIIPIQNRLRERLAETLGRLYALAPSALPTLALEYPPRRELGDLSTPIAFELARALRKPPRVIAQEIAGAIGEVDGVSRIEAAPNGYLNVYVDRVAFMRSAPNAAQEPVARTIGKTIVEHTAINPNKAAHTGHLPN